MAKPPLNVEYRPVTDLIPYARNARTHDDAQVAQIAASIKEFGFNNPILIAPDDSIIAGHGRALAALKLKLEKVPCIRLGHLTDSQRRAYVLADNQIALNAGWDKAMLALELVELKDEVDLGLTGFGADELSEIMYGPNFDPVGEDEQGKLDEKAKVKCPECGHDFAP